SWGDAGVAIYRPAARGQYGLVRTRAAGPRSVASASSALRGARRAGGRAQGGQGRESAMTTVVDQAYAEVQRVTRARAKNFAYGIMVLPREKRRAVAAIYAFAREVDDVADGDLPPEEKRVRLEALRAALDDPPPSHMHLAPMHVALTDARARFGIPRDALSALVDGGLQDLEQTRYATFDELRAYCEKVAGAVGIACVAVYGSDDVERAQTLGIALQLINIMRDVAEDLALGRVYLP